MRITRTRLVTLTAVLLAGAAASVSLESSASAAPPPAYGVAHLGTQVNLPAGVWTDVPLQVVLPRPGTYEIDADVRGRLSGTPSVNSYITARLWNVTRGAEVSQSERLVYQIIDLNPGTAQAGGNATAPISELIRVDRPTEIRLQAVDVNAVGRASIAQIYSDNAGYSSLRFDRVGP